MDETKEKYNPNPRATANPLSVLFFWYNAPTFRKGYSKTLEVDDLYNTIKEDRSTYLGNKLEKNWMKQLEKANRNEKFKPSLLKAIVATFWPQYLHLALLIFLDSNILRIVQPMMLGRLLDYFKPGSLTTKDDALCYAGAIVAINITTLMLANHYNMGVFHSGMKVRAACCALVYRKALRLSKTALGDNASGKVVNLLSNDVSRFDQVSLFINQMWSGPVNTCIVAYLLYQDSGLGALFGIVVLFIIVPLQSYTGKLSAIFRKQTALRTDERIRLMDEIISGIQVIKMYAWEKPFDQLIKIVRKAEIKIVTKSSYVRAVFMAFSLFTTRLSLFCTLVSMVVTQQEITASRVFVFMAYYNLLSMSMGMMFVRGISEIAELLVALRRLRAFLLSDEFEHVGAPDPTSDNKYDVSLKDLTVKWNLANSDNALENVNLTIHRGILLGVIGPVGCGKSSLLQTLLGELEIVRGRMNISGTVSYASQEPWVFAATIRQNILFGNDYDKSRYHDVIKACALEKDFEQFPNGDLSIVGDKGASLSGGQKARINLARAVYRDADIYLLDDPLSAVDIHVAKQLYENCINGYLGSKTRILVTHQVQLLKDADHIIILNNGCVENEGTFSELSRSDNVYSKLLTADAEEEDKQARPEFSRVNSRMSRQISLSSRKASVVSMLSNLSVNLLPNESDDEEKEEEEEERDEIQVKDMQEQSSKGTVKGSLLFNYLLSGGNIVTVMTICILYILSQLTVSSVDYFVSYWVTLEEFRNTSSNATSTEKARNLQQWSTETCIYIYGSLLVTLFILALVRSMFFYQVAMWCSQKLHYSIFSSIIRVNMRFFDTNPSGRILNRFSKDIGAIDELLPKVIMDSSQILLQMVGALILVSIVNPYFLVLIALQALLFGYVRKFYLKTSKNIKRLEGIMRSPVFTHLNATLQGLTTIRSFGAQDILMDEFDKHQDYHSSAWYMFISTSTAFGFFLDIFCAIFLALLTFSFTVYGEAFGMTGGQVGLAISQATALTGMIQWGMKASAEVTNQLMSVERVLEYRNLPAEKQPEKPIAPSPKWPEQGKILFNDMCLKYVEDGAYVLKHLNLSILPKEKVGVVGRTGAGKSSLISALFRLAPIDGEIVIDNIDTKDLSLEVLRSRISIIPQDPVLFSGTLRYNLDPFNQYTDEVLYKAIEDVELKDPANIINRLENRVMDRGANYSVGQRQLICLARAIIRNNKILMLDEATANVDPQTDALIQKTIRRKFVDCTVLTVAHRLNTIMDSDKVLVMDAGCAAEYDHPHILLQNTNGIFFKMVAETGRAMSEQLRKIAKDNYQRISAVPE